MVLHTFAKGLNQRLLMEKCLSLASPQDAILLIEDGVHWAAPAPLASILASSKSPVFCLSEDATARGMDLIQQEITPIDYEGFVDLAVNYTTSIAWF